jgi:peptide/nickel transport system permease protein
VQLDYIAKRFGVFLLIVWLAATLNFFLPRLSGQDPVRAKLLQQAQLGGYVQAGIEAMTREYEQRFGLDKPLWFQYLAYLQDMSRLHFNYSISHYPRTVNEIMAEAIPWTVGLLGTTTVLSFTIGSLLGALLAWPRAPRYMRFLMPPLWALHAIPFFLCGLILMYVLAFQLQWLPMFGGYTAGAFPALTPAFVGDVLKHAILPALSIILVATGGWALTMRGMMVTTQGEDYVTFAEAKGLKSLTIFLRYCLALSLGQILSGAVLVEVIFAYPGIGTVLYHAIRENDHFLIQGIVFSVIVALGLATLMLDLIYPWLDPRITYRRA